MQRSHSQAAKVETKPETEMARLVRLAYEDDGKNKDRKK